MVEPESQTISFGDFEIDTIRRRLIRGGEPISLHAKAYDLLVFLATQNGRLVSKDELLHKVWDNRFVEESNLAVQISNLRKALGETASSPRFLLTVPGKGYKFAADRVNDGFVVETHTVSELTIEQSETVVSSGIGFRGWTLALGGISALVAVGMLVGFAAYWARSTSSAPPRQPKITKLTTSGKVAAATISPDAKFAVFSLREENGESLWLRQIESGSETRIVEEKPVEYVGLTVSPDGQYVFATVFAKNDIDPSVHRIPILGGPSVAVPNISTGSSIAISPDGKRFAFTSSNSTESETLLGTAAVDGSDVRFLIRAKHDVRYLTMFQSSPVAWSGNGDIAVAVHEKTGDKPGHAIIMVDPSSGAERYLTERRWSNIEDLVWIDDDRLAFIASEEDGLADQIWTISRSTGDVSRLTNELRPYSWLGAAGGKLLTVQLSSTTSLRIGELTEGNSSVKSNEVFTASEYINELDWTNDGGIVFASRNGGGSELWRMNSDGTGQRQLSAEARVGFGIGVDPTDGSLVFASKQNGKRVIARSDPNGQGVRSISDGPDQAPDVSSDGKVVFHRGIGYAEGVFITSRTEPTARLLRSKCYFPAISFDGSKAACYFMDAAADRKWRIALISTQNGATIRVLDLPLPIFQRQIRFHPSGKYISQIFWSGQNLKLLLLPIDGTAPLIFDGLGKGTSHQAEWSTDGRRFLYPVVTEAQDVVMLTTSE